MLLKKNFFLGSKRGFSLIELLLVVSLLPIVGFAVYSNFSAGINVWARVVQAVPQEDLNIFDIKLARELRSMMRSSETQFQGEEEQVVFAAAIQARPELGGEHGIGRIRIYYDSSARAILKQVWDYSQMYKESPGVVTALMQKVGSFELSYFSNNPLQDAYVWESRWKSDPKKLPTAIKVLFTVEGSAQPQERVVFIPVGGEFK